MATWYAACEADFKEYDRVASSRCLKPVVVVKNVSTAMESNNYEQPSAAMMPPSERFASATTNSLSPSDLMISCTTPDSSAGAPDSVSTIALARINRLPLLHWLISAINGMFVGEAPVQPRPVGMLLECGRFASTGSDVWAYDWYGHGRRCLVARMADVASAEELALRLNALLRP
jgi:hypothetical protein